MSTCRDVRRRILERLDGTLAIEAEFRLERHLEGCARCREFEERAAGLEELLARLPEPPTERLDLERAVGAVRARVGGGDEEVRGAAVPRGARWRRAGAWLAAAAALVAAALLLSRPWRVPAQPGPDLARGLPEPQAAEPRATEAGAGAESPEARGAPADAIDRARLERAREEVRTRLAACAAELDLEGDRDEAARLAERIDRETRPLHLRGWPVERIAAGLLAGEDADVARAAARYLGLRGGRVAADDLERALENEATQRAALCALADLGPDGLGGLAGALGDPRLRAAATRAIVAVGGPRAARTLAARLRAEGDAAPELVAALGELGAVAIDPLVDLVADGELPAPLLPPALARVEDVERELEARLLRARPGERAIVLMRVAAALGVERCLPRIEALATERATRAAAVDALAAMERPDALAALVRLRESGRVPAELLEPALAASVARNAPHLALAVDEAIGAAATGELAALLELLVTSEAPEGAPMLAALASCELLDSELRQAAVLAAGELGSAEELEAIRALFRALGERERRLAAACLVALDALGGEEACRAALDEADERETRTLLTLLRRRHAKGRTTASFFKLARELEPVLARRETSDWSTTP